MNTYTPKCLADAVEMPNGPRAKYWMLKFAPKGFDTRILKQLGCDQIRAQLTYEVEWS